MPPVMPDEIFTKIMFYYPESEMFLYTGEFVLSESQVDRIIPFISGSRYSEKIFPHLTPGQIDKFLSSGDRALRLMVLDHPCCTDEHKVRYWLSQNETRNQ